MRPEVSFFLVDARGRACPMPVLMLAKALREHEHVELLADDPAAQADIEALCASAKHELVGISKIGRLLRAHVRRSR